MFYPKIGDYVLLRLQDVRFGQVVRIVLTGLRHDIYGISFTAIDGSRFIKFCSREFIVKILPPVNLDSLKLGDKVRLASGRVETVKEIMPSGKLVRVLADRFCVAYKQTGSTVCGDQSFNIVEIIPQVDLHTLKAGDTVELASGATKEIKSVAYSPLKEDLEVVFTTCKSFLPWHYNRNGAQPYFPMDSIVKILPKPKLDFSMNTVDLTTLKEGDTVHLSDRSAAEVVSVASKMLGTVYLIRLRRFGFTHYCVDGCSLDKDKPSIVRIVDTSTAKERVVPKPKLNLYTLEPGAVVTLANGNTKTVLEVDLQSRAHTNHICIKFADGTRIYNPDGTRPPGRDSAYNIVGVTTAAMLAGIKADKKFFESIDVSAIKRGDRLTLANGKEVIAGKVTARLAAGETYTVWHENGCPIVDVHANGIALRTESHAWSIVKITPKPKPTPLTIGGHVVKPGDVLTRAYGDRIVVDKITLDPCGNWKVRHSAHGDCFFKVDSSGRCHLSPDLTITAVVPNQTVTQGQPGTRMTLERLTQLVEQRPSAFTEIAQLTGRSVTDLLSDLEKGLSVPWPKPITTPPTKKDADPIGQVAVLDKDGDWMQEEWWAARDMLDAGEITGWAHTQAWRDASDPWN